MNYNLDSQGFSLEWIKENRVFIFEHKAMATIFSVFIQHDDYTYASQAVTEAFDLLNRLEQDLSRYKENSDVSRINELKSGESTVVSPDTMDCLIKCKILQDNTMGVFNPTIGDLINQSKKNKNSFKIYNKSKIGNLVLDSDSFIVSVEKNPITIEKGALAAKALSLMNNKKITSLCVFDKKDKKKTIGVLHVHTVLQSNIS